MVLIHLGCDATLGEMTAGGIVEPNAQWTALAEGHVNSALREFMTTRNATMGVNNTKMMKLTRRSFRYNMWLN